MLRVWDPARPARLLIDASELAVSAIPEQPDDAGAFHPVAFEPRKLTQPERSYPPHLLDMLAGVHALKARALSAPLAQGKWSGAIAGGGEVSQVEESGLRWRGAVSGGEERSQVERSGLRWRGAIAGGGERSQVEGSGLRWEGAVLGRGE